MSALPLEAGDIVIVPHGERHQLLAHPAAPSTPWRELIAQRGWSHWAPGMRFKSVDLHYGVGSPATVLISGVFAFEDRRRNPLVEALPRLLMVRAKEASLASQSVSSISALLNAELVSGKPGAETVAARFGDILFIQVVRHYLATGDGLPPGWLRGLADPEVAPAFALMHGQPGRDWSVASLARELGMSRSRFAARFRETVGRGPLEYLTHWRMYQAAGRLARAKTPLARLAADSGYRSEVAFSKAFKRWSGQSPAEYRRGAGRLSSAAPQRTVNGETLTLQGQPGEFGTTTPV